MDSLLGHSMDPAQAAWAVLKGDNPRSINFGPDGPTSISGAPTGPIPPTVGRGKGPDYAIPEGGTPCAVGGPNCTKAATTKNQHDVPLDLTPLLSKIAPDE